MRAPGGSDEALVAAYRAGDEHAFATLHDRYRPRLVAFARRMVRDSGLADDIVQEALWRASRALRRDQRPMNLRPWLYRLVRNCALDELGRSRNGGIVVEQLPEGALQAPADHEPPATAQRRADVREVLGDIAELPDNQRHALVRRELDGLSHQQVADELGITAGASKSLLLRARGNLIKARDERGSTCGPARRALLAAADERRRPTAAALRHLAGCGPCRSYRLQLRRTSSALALMQPGPLLLLGIGLGGAQLTGLGLAGKSAGVKAGTAAVLGATTLGAVGLGVEVFGPGDPAPQTVRSPAVPGGVVGAGRPLPPGTSVVVTSLKLLAGPHAPRRLSATCPAGLRVADLLPPRGLRVPVAYAPNTNVGTSRRATITISALRLPVARDVRVAVLCKRPNARGSLRAP